MKNKSCLNITISVCTYVCEGGDKKRNYYVILDEQV